MISFKKLCHRVVHKWAQQSSVKNMEYWGGQFGLILLLWIVVTALSFYPLIKGDSFSVHRSQAWVTARRFRFNGKSETFHIRQRFYDRRQYPVMQSTQYFGSSFTILNWKYWIRFKSMESKLGPAEFSNNLTQNTCLGVSSMPRPWLADWSVFNWGWSWAL